MSLNHIGKISISYKYVEARRVNFGTLIVRILEGDAM